MFKIAVFIICIVAGAYSVRREFKKLPEEDKVRLKEELRNPLPILVSGMIYLGYLTMFVSIIFDIYILRYIAFFLMGIGFIVNGAEEWRLNIKKAFLFVVLGSAIVSITGLFATKSLW